MTTAISSKANAYMTNDVEFKNWLRDFFQAFGVIGNSAMLELWAESLSEYPLDALKAAAKAFGKTQQRGGGTLLPGALIAFLPSQLGHPLPELAWNHAPKTEHSAGYVTSEMMGALADCQDSLNREDYIGARVAFLESYRARVRAAEAQKIPAKFFYSRPSEGSREQRLQIEETKTIEALKNGWITNENAKKKLERICSELAKPLPLALERISGLVSQAKTLHDDGLKKIENQSAPISVKKLDLIDEYEEIKVQREASKKAELEKEEKKEKELKEKRRLLLAQAASVLNNSKAW